MTINIIQHGKFYDPPKVVNCRNCRCIFSYGGEDVMKKTIAELDYLYLECPECRWTFEIEQ